MIFCKSHSNCGQKIVFLDFQICFGQALFGIMSACAKFAQLCLQHFHCDAQIATARLCTLGLDMCQVCTEAIDCVAL